MSLHLEVCGERFTFSEVDLPAAIKGLREALGKSPESMARILGCSLPAYQKWELGTLAPSGEWLLRMLQVCPDEETRNAFRIRPERRSAARKSAAPPPQLPLSTAERMRYRDIASKAVDTIFGCGEAGDQAADLRLIEFADRLQPVAAYCDQVRQGKK
jgi:transcriptional regulator with XRE-family HTH domain